MLALVVLSLGMACSRQTDRGASQQQSDFPQTVERLDEEALTEMVTKRNGKVLFLNIWATWCLPCKEEFPDIIRLAEEYRHRNVEFIGISADYPDEIDSRIKPFLRDQKVNFQNYVQNFDSAEEFINWIDVEWNGALPVTVIYDTGGNRELFLQGKHDYGFFKEKLDAVVG
jgi:thiol-disulfide isomerase/thioredoxin